MKNSEKCCPENSFAKCLAEECAAWETKRDPLLGKKLDDGICRKYHPATVQHCHNGSDR